MFLIFSAVFIGTLVSTPSKASVEEGRLLDDLLQKYNSIERPVADHNEAIIVKMQLLLQQILEVDAKNQLIKMVIWVQQEWNDYKMRWDPSEYGGIAEVILPSSSSLWKPDVLLFNSAEDSFDNSFPVNAVVSYNGDILFVPPGIIKTSCNIDITWFPFDEQICCLRFGSWTYKTSRLDLSVNKPNVSAKHDIDLTYYVENSEWELIATPADRLLKPFLNDSFTELHFRLHIRRKIPYYVMNWIIPSIIISLNNLLGFMLPSECGEKITLQTTNLLAVTVFLGQVTAVTPTSSKLPVIGIFFSFSMVILGCSVMMTILVVNLHFRMPDTYEMNPWVRKAFLEWLPWLLLMQRPGYNFRKPKTKIDAPEHKTLLVQNNDDTQSSGDDDNSAPFCRSRKKSDAILKQMMLRRQGMTVPKNSMEECLLRIERLMLEYSMFFKDVRSYLEEDEKDKTSQADWRYIAKVVDRLCLFAFTFSILLAFLFLLINMRRTMTSSFKSSLIPCVPQNTNY
uniref:Neurotransmitter-gated ion-channel ligand-binding domain-containing protein n=1 Tax=Syphacia muris TaxID=451379 RepID=A0A0N5ADI3_9BILA